MKEYTIEEIESIKKNLKKTFDTEFIPIDVTLGGLLKNKLSKFKFIKGEEFVFFNPFPNKSLNTDIGWHVLEIIYQRLDIVFFKVTTSNKPKKEHWTSTTSHFCEHLIPGVLNIDRFGIPRKNLPLFIFKKPNNCPYDIVITTKNNKEEDILKII